MFLKSFKLTTLFAVSLSTSPVSAQTAGENGNTPPPSVGSDLERASHSLSLAIAYEAGFEPAAGQQAVAEVILNRTRHPAYP